MSREPAGEIDRDRMAELTARLPDEMVRAELFEMGRPLVRALARRFMGRGEPIEDLVQVASMGMLKAIDNFDSDRSDHLLSYATAVIIGELRHHFRDTVRMMRIPRRLLAARRRIDHSVEDLTQQLGRSPRLAEIVDATGLDEETVLEAVATVEAGSPLPLDELDDTANHEAMTVTGDYSRLDEVESVSVQLAGLPARERQILFLRFFRGYSQEEVAREIGVSQVQVSRILSSSLEKLRKSISVPDG